ncbi:MAG: hypothetical protein COW88_03385 [Candidatus Lloydbacteria bacterium CG22_combo_CG10-13_8_21_14_all_47_15]|uniref:RecF/RecN/SMC N-terminal domain-containing protein n=1 Tax=Candidatus Lloydbacteria bacterium CG22_combo_CG10-13_8_21_14_all_47_15 TaxID=1974635 RepID=A0A2H0CUD2_9BACT|nr:MAG: hypothetical protein COW88_03385 [Candidatus Lloydbacteria bacterium CG22_combo_CG10-13_8_21_14_all_47_15]
MRLKKIEMSGFKSFGKKTELLFGATISVIVGPNGAGKSNIAEGMRFVLGEQSLKSMRGKRGEDLIWNGSGSVPRAGRASVTAVFDNHDRAFSSIDFDEVAIRRVVHRDGINEYSVNGSLVRLKDIVELLSAVHIGASSHHIISQGEADRFLLASITDRRGMIEDALGLKIYHYKKAESERKLAKTDENIKEVGLLRRELSPHLKFLKKQAIRVEQARVMRTELVEKYREYLGREFLYLSSVRKALLDEKIEPTSRLAGIERELEKARKEAVQDGGSKHIDTIVVLERDLNRVREEKDALSRELGRLEGMLEYRVMSGPASSSESVVPLPEVRRFSDDIQALIARTEESDDISFVRRTLAALRELITDFMARYRSGGDGSASREYMDEEEKLNAAKDELAQSVQEKENEEEALRARAATLRMEVEAKKDASHDAERRLFELMSEETRTRGILQTLAAREDMLLREEDDFKRELGEAGIAAGRAATEYESAAISSETAETETRDKQYERKRTIEKLKVRLEEYGGGSGEEIIKEYEDTAERDRFLERELADLEKTSASLRDLIADLVERLDKEFKDGVEKINARFQELFAMLFGGGTARLSEVTRMKRRRIDAGLLDDDIAVITGDEPEIEDGIDIDVSLPKKKIRGLQMLSGGERALTSIALLFSVAEVNPPPFMVLDETDAALDEANSEKYGNMLESLAGTSQLIVVTHNRGTMAHAGILYGVTMGADGVSKILSIKFDEAKAIAE